MNASSVPVNSAIPRIAELPQNPVVPAEFRNPAEYCRKERKTVFSDFAKFWFRIYRDNPTLVGLSKFNLFLVFLCSFSLQNCRRIVWKDLQNSRKIYCFQLQDSARNF